MTSSPPPSLHLNPQPLPYLFPSAHCQRGGEKWVGILSGSHLISLICVSDDVSIYFTEFEGGARITGRRWCFTRLPSSFQRHLSQRLSFRLKFSNQNWKKKYKQKWIYFYLDSSFLEINLLKNETNWDTKKNQDKRTKPNKSRKMFKAFISIEYN